ncbi:MAG: hypothetical protein II896_05740 [Clostridia bacterium]|nr:hypothetical protein [Clostridia bacterium]
MKNVNKLMNMDSVYLRRLYNTSCLAFRTENRFAKKGGVVFVGDSITDFCNLDTYYPELNAVNRGISGDTIEGILGRLDVSIFDLEPSVVVLLGGANNFAEGYDDVETFVIDTYRAILSQIKARLPQTKVVVQSVYPVSDVSFHNRYKYGHGHIRAINAKLEELTLSMGYVYADVYSVLATGDEEFDSRYTDDGLHPNAKGYAAISAYLRPIVDGLRGEMTARGKDNQQKASQNEVVDSVKAKEAATSLIEKMLVAVFLMAMGVLFCVRISGAISITCGVILCIYGVVNLILIGIGHRPLFSIMGVIDGAIIAIGIAFCVHDLSMILVQLLPYIFTILGALMLIDGFIGYFGRKQGGKLRVVLFSIAGAVMFSLGISFFAVEEFRLGYEQLIFGVILCVASVLLATATIVGRLKKEGIR